MATVNITSREQLMTFASRIIEVGTPSIGEIAGDIVPTKITAEQEWDNYVAQQNFTDALNNLANGSEKHAASVLHARAGKSLEELTTKNAEYVSLLVAASLDGKKIEGKTFTISPKLKSQITQELSAAEKAADDLIDQYGVYRNALSAMLYGESFDPKQINGRSDERNEMLHQQLLSAASAEMGSGYTEYADMSRYKSYNGEYVCSDPTMRIDMSRCKDLTMQNYKDKLAARPLDPAVSQWCMDTISSMFRNSLGVNSFNEITAKSYTDLFKGLYIDGQPVSARYPMDSFDLCAAKLMSDVLDGGHKLSVAQMTKLGDTFVPTDDFKSVSIRPSLTVEEPKYSLWDKIKRFFGHDKKEKQVKAFEQRVSLSDLANEDLAKSIKSFNTKNQNFAKDMSFLTDLKERYDTFTNTIEANCFACNYNGDVSEYMKNNAFCLEYNGDQVSQENMLKTLGRLSSRATLCTAYLMTNDGDKPGLTLDQIENPTDEVKKIMQRRGKEFMDIATIRSAKDLAHEMYPNYSDEQLESAIKTDEAFKDRYNSMKEEHFTKLDAVMGKIHGAIEAMNGNLPAVNYYDSENIRENGFTNYLYVNICCDLTQSLTKTAMDKTDLTAVNPRGQGGKPMYVGAYGAKEFGYNGQGENLFENMVKYCQDEGLYSNFYGNVQYSNLANILTCRALSCAIQNGKYTKGIDTTVAISPMLCEAINKDIKDGASKPDRNQFIGYVQDLITGKAPMPDDIAMNFDNPLVKAYENYKASKNPQLARTQEMRTPALSNSKGK